MPRPWFRKFAVFLQRRIDTKKTERNIANNTFRQIPSVCLACSFISVKKNKYMCIYSYLPASGGASGKNCCWCYFHRQVLNLCPLKPSNAAPLRRAFGGVNYAINSSLGKCLSFVGNGPIAFMVFRVHCGLHSDKCTGTILYVCTQRAGIHNLLRR